MSRTPAIQELRDHRIGVLMLVGAAVFWSLNGVLIKTINDHGHGPHGVVIAFYRSLVAGLFLLPLARRRMGTLMRDLPAGAEASGPRIRIQPAAIVCVLCFAAMTVCFVVANTHTEASNAIILQYTSTFWIFAFSPLMLGERPKAGDVGMLVVAVVGIGIIFAGNASAGLFGLVNALLAGLFYGLLTIMIRKLRGADAAAITVLNNLGSAALILPFVFAAGGLVVATRAALLLMVMGVVQLAIPYYLFSLGLARVPASQAGLITLLEPVLVPVWTFLVLGERLPPATAAGGGLILAALIVYGFVSHRAALPPGTAVPQGQHLEEEQTE
ncbi:MAG: DMT family transporter [Phycisphaerae bacterium]